MKYVLALIGGFALTLAVFVAGAVMATVYIVAEPRSDGPATDTAAMWSREPVRVADNSQLERVGPEPAALSAQTDAAPQADGGVDGLITGAIAAEASEPPEQRAAAADQISPEEAAQAERLRLAHDRWCSRRFRSYSAEDGSYQPYGGGRQLCESPYLAELEAGAGGVYTTEASAETGFALEGEGFGAVIETVDAAGPGWGGPVTRDHMQSCFDRYRSYRPEDNTYQPYDGGPRRQCE